MIGNFPEITASQTPLEQIFGNLISNAVKHHDQKQGEIEIEAIEARASIQRQSTEDVFNVNSIHVNARLTLKYVDG